MVFADRIDAGRKLAAQLHDYRGRGAIVLALPRGGVPVGAEVAGAMGAELDLLIVRKIGVPFQPEMAMGAVVDATEPIVVRNDEVMGAAHISKADFERVLREERAELARRSKHYLAGRPHPVLKGRIVIVVDDGLATGATMRAALTALRAQSPAELVAAVPVATPDGLSGLGPLADRVVCVEVSRSLGAIGLFYRQFEQLNDEDVIEIMKGIGPPSTTS